MVAGFQILKIAVGACAISARVGRTLLPDAFDLALDLDFDPHPRVTSPTCSNLQQLAARQHALPGRMQGRNVFDDRFDRGQKLRSSQPDYAGASLSHLR
jgi:hypothetical protein